MKYLLIDTATSHLVVAIIINNEIKYIFNEETGKDMSTMVMPIINEAFTVTGIKPRDIDKIFAVNGPGSFTGIRVGLTFAKTMAWSLKIPVIPISSLELIASGTPSSSNVALINARRGFVYAGIYDQDLNNIYDDKYTLFNDIKDKGTLISYDIDEAIKPQIDVLKVVKKHKNESGINPHQLNPKYLKITEAEEKLKNND